MYALSLLQMWETSFGSQHVMSQTGVKKKLKKIVKDYDSQVYNKGRDSKGIFCKSRGHFKSNLDNLSSFPFFLGTNFHIK